MTMATSVDLRLRFYVVNDGAPNITYKATLTYEPKNPGPGWVWPATMPEYTGTGPTLQVAAAAAWAAYKAANPVP